MIFMEDKLQETIEDYHRLSTVSLCFTQSSVFSCIYGVVVMAFGLRICHCYHR